MHSPSIVPHVRKGQALMRQITMIFFVLLALGCSSCCKLFDDGFLECKSNCYTINMEGYAVNRVTNSGLKNIPFTLKWSKPMCWFCSDNTIAINSSNEQGYFVFNNQIDTSYFRNGYHLTISVPEYEDYIIIPYDRDISIYNLDEDKISDLDFTFYPKTQLQIQVVNVKNDTFEYFSVDHYFCDNLSYADYIIYKKDSLSSRIINTVTSSDIKTYIKWRKRFLTKDIDRIDSIVCKKGIINKYKIEY